MSPSLDPQAGTRPATEDTGRPTPHLELLCSRQLPGWLRERGVSLAFTTYQAGKLFLIGVRPEDGRLSISERTLPRCMGLAASGGSLYVGTLYQLWRFENALAQGQCYQGYDRLYVPRVGYVTGDLDIHDLAVGADGRIVFVNTLFGCLATVSETASFVPLWRPPFLSRLAAEDRCHLNGLAMLDGRPRYVTAVSESDVADGWRDHRRDGGVVVGVDENEVLLRGLSMPHSPRVYRGRLWLHRSGTGHFGFADLEGGRFEPVAFCPGYLRGLAFAGDTAVVGLSKVRRSKALQALHLEGELAARKAVPRCAIHLIDLRTGDTVHWLRLAGVVEELYDVAVLPGTTRPTALGFQSDEIRRVISVGPEEPS